MCKMTDIVELKRKIAEYLDHYATLYFHIYDYREELGLEEWTEQLNEGPPYANLIGVGYETNSIMEKEVRDIVRSALNQVELIDDVSDQYDGFLVWYECDLDEYETKTIGMDILNTVKTNLREDPKFNVTEIDNENGLTLQLYFNRASEKRVEDVMNYILSKKRERERKKLQRSTKRRRLSLRF